MPPKAAYNMSTPASVGLAATTPSSTSKKRSASGQVKYYSVRAGHTTGVFTEYKDVQQAVTGFKGAVFKSFLDRADADAFAAGRNVAGSSTTKKKAVDKFYGVANGHEPGVYTNWDAAQKQIEGFKGPRYKRFATREEAEQFVRSGGKVVATPDATASKDTKAQSAGSKLKRAKPSVLASKAGQDLDNAEDELAEGEINTIRPAKRAKMYDDVQDNAFDDTTGDDLGLDDIAYIRNGTQNLKIYTDGSSLGNGKVGAVAGYGVFFGVGDERNISEELPGPLQTNQRAELTAIARALSIVPPSTTVTIYTDSRYSIDCVTVWFQNWERNGWLSSMRAPVQNKDIIQEVLMHIRNRDSQGGKTNFVWIKGHGKDPNNIAADRLAVAGAEKAKARREREAVAATFARKR